MNIISFDIEEWYIEKQYHGGRESKYKEFDALLDSILELLYKHQTKATFFCLGKIASEFPNVIKKIDSLGHEIGCHSDKHTWLNKINRAEALEDTRIAVDSIEQLIGHKVLSYRAPAFSIGESNKWVFEILAKCGIGRDASVFSAVRDFGGFPTFESNEPVLVNMNGINIKEFPVPIIKFLGRGVAYSGGGYFRFFPLSFIQRQLDKSDYSISYFHISDLLPEGSGVMSKVEYEKYFKEPGTLINRYKRYIKGNLEKKSAFKKLSKLIENNSFLNIEQADKIISWERIVNL